jgi:hypothetical protein
MKLSHRGAMLVLVGFCGTIMVQEFGFRTNLARSPAALLGDAQNVQELMEISAPGRIRPHGACQPQAAALSWFMNPGFALTWRTPLGNLADPAIVCTR